MITKRDRYRGALVGVLAGDALLAPYETWTATRVKEDLEKRGGLVPFDYPDPWGHDKMFPKGRPTDDSDQTAALAESLIACGQLVREDLYYRLRRVIFDHVSPLWDGKAVGAGKTTRDALRYKTYAESQARSTEGAFPSNGSLMRSAPLALYFGTCDSVGTAAVQDMCEVTHAHPDATHCVNLYVAVLATLLENKGQPKRLDSWIQGVPSIRNGHIYPPRDPETWPGRGAAALTLHIGLWALLNAKNFRDGLTKVAMIGGDTDTYGAVAGGLLGAKFGLGGIPKEWREVLLGYEK